MNSGLGLIFTLRGLARTLLILNLLFFSSFRTYAQLNPDFTANATTVCSGTVVTFTDASTGTTVSTTYSWSFGAGANPATATGPGPIQVIYTGSGQSTVSLTLTDTSTATTTKPNFITINPLPTATLTGSADVCQNDISPVLTFAGANGTAPYTFVYTVNGGGNQTITTTTGNSITLSVPTSVAGTYLYSLVSVTDASSTACSQAQSGTATVTVNPLPVAIISGTTTVCKNDPSPLITFSGSAGTSPYTFTYKINGGSNQTITTTSGNSVTVPVPTGSAGSYLYTLVSVRDGSPTSCSEQQSGSATVTINPLPSATISGSASVCKNATSPNITFTGSNGTPPYTFIYTVNSGSNQVITTTLGSSVTTPVSTVTAGTFTYALVSVSDASASACTQAQGGTATVVVNDLPLATLTGTTTVCQNAVSPVVTFTGSNGTPPYTFVYRINGGSNQFITTTSGSSVNVPVPTGTAGIFTYALQSVEDASPSVCSQAQSGNAVITVNPLPVASINGSISVCKNDPSPLITFTGSQGTPPYTFIYKINGGTNQSVSTISGSSVTVPAPTIAAGTYTYSLVSVSDASPSACSQVQSGNAVITVNNLPTATISGTTEVCKNSGPVSVIFTGSAGVSPYTFTYKINNGTSQTVTTTTGNSVNVAVPVTTAGTYTYSLVSVTDASSTSCSQSQTGSATVTVDEMPAANAGSGGDACGLTFTLGAVPSIGTGTWTKSSGPGTSSFSPNQNTPNATVTVSGYGSYVFTWTEVNGTCSSSKNITINFYQKPVSNAGTGGNSCGLSFSLKATPSIGTGSWTQTAGPGTSVFTPDIHSANALASVSAYGTYTFTWTEVNATCSSSSSVNVSFYQQPVPDAGTGGNNCGLSFILNAVPSVGTGTWTKTSGTGTAVFAPDTHHAGATVTVSVPGNYTFTWTEQNGSCSGSSSVNVSFVQNPSANAGSGGDVCGSSFSLNAVPGNGAGTWTKFSGPGNATFSPDASHADAIVTVDQYGPYVFSWTEVSLTCQSTAQITVTFHEPPQVSAGKDTVICKGKSVQLNGTGTGTFHWSPENLVSNPAIANPVVSPSIPTWFRLTVTDQYGCKNSDSTEVDVKTIPVARVEGDLTLEYVFDTPITAVQPGPGETGVWLLIMGSGTIADTTNASTAISGLALGKNVLVWTVNNNVCQPSRALLTVTVHDLKVPSLITPNMDGRNDYFVLQGIETLGRTDMTVFDRLGVMVYHNTNYNNDWNGIDNKGNPLPEDTYFYILKADNGVQRSGYIVIRR